MAKCLERPLDICCLSCMKDHPLLSTKECIFPYCEPLRRYCDFRVTWKRPFLTCVLFGCCFGLGPALIILGTLLLSYLLPGDLNTQILSANCESVAAWSMLEFIFCMINFMFTCWIFGELKKPEEERDHCYERDMTELYRRYLVYQYPHLLQEMKLLEESHKLAKKQIADQKEELKIEIEALKSEVADLQGASSIATKDEATSIQEKKAIATNKLKEAEKSLMRLDSGSDDSLTDRLKTVFGSDKTCTLYGLVLFLILKLFSFFSCLLVDLFGLSLVLYF